MSELDDIVAAYRSTQDPAVRAQLKQRYDALRGQQDDESGWEHLLRRGFGGDIPIETAAFNAGTNPFRLIARGVGQGLNESPNERAERLARQAPATILAAPPPGGTPPALTLRAPGAAPGAAAASGAAPTVAPAARAEAEGNTLFARLLNQESGNRQFDAQGRLITSPKMAFGAAQLMPGTAADLAREMGVTVEQLRADPDLNRRAGERYFNQQLTKYGGNTMLALAAYNAGPGRVDQWISRFGDPRTGQISDAAFAAQIPFQETRDYIANITGGTSGPRLSAPTPQDVMSFIPDPEAVPRIDLPDAPQREAPAARPTLLEVDKEALLAPLREAMAVESRDTSHDNWDRITALLAGAAQGMSQVDPNAGIGQMLLAGGGAGLQGFRAEQDEQRALTEEEKEARRQVEIALAQAGYGLDLGNHDVRNQNLGINWQSGEDVKNTNFDNATLSFNTIVQELLQNSNIDAGNIGARNQVNLARGQLGANALGGQFDVQNQSSAAGWEANQRRQNQALTQPGAQTLQAIGISPEPQAGESDLIKNARSAATFIEQGNSGAAMRALATELLISQRYTQEMGDSVIGDINKAIQQGNNEAAILLILGQLQSNPVATKEMIAELAPQGFHVANMMQQRGFN